jgi:hypothetical protein
MTRWAVNVLPTLPFYAFGNVAILGDAVSPVLWRSGLYQNLMKNEM